MTAPITRRQFLRGSLAGGGLFLAAWLTPGDALLQSFPGGRALASDTFSPSLWLEITPDNIVTVIVNKSEMGQGVATALPMIVAEELDADWSQVTIETAPAAEKYIDPALGAQLTAGSFTIRDMQPLLSKAGAAARQMLVQAAADAWNVATTRCETSRGSVRNLESGRTLTFGQLCEQAGKLPVPKNPFPKNASQYKIVGNPIERLDIPAKVDGSAVFGVDVFVRDMLYAAIAYPPAYGAKMISCDREAAKKIPGVYQVVDTERGVAVCGDTIYAAGKGREALNARWDKGPNGKLSSRTVEKQILLRLKEPGLIVRKDVGVRDAFANASVVVEATYALPFVAHAAMEPINCTAHVRPEGCELWVSTQNQSGALHVAAEETGLRPDQINIFTTYLGGGFGRRIETDFIKDALQASKATGAPVKLFWTREEDFRNDFHRPAGCCALRGALDAQGRLTAWSHRIAAPSIWSRLAPDRLTDGIDPAAVDGVVDTVYDIPNFDVEYAKVETPVPVGLWRSAGHSCNAFTMESFMDEMAHAAGRDPLEFRLGLLKNKPRARRVLQIAAEKAGWGKPLPAGWSLGIAHHFAFGSYVAQAAAVSVDRKTRKVKVRKVVCVVDCGAVVNPDTVTAQMEGGIVFGLSAALKEKVQFARGGVASKNFKDYGLLTMSECPQIEVHIVKSQEPAGGIGEAAVPPIAPAVANAVFASVGARIRRLPMTPAAVRTALHGTGSSSRAPAEGRRKER